MKAIGSQWRVRSNKGLKIFALMRNIWILSSVNNLKDTEINRLNNQTGDSLMCGQSSDPLQLDRFGNQRSGLN